LKVKIGKNLPSFPMAGLDVHNSFSRAKSVNQINPRLRSSSFSSNASTYLSELAMLFKPPRSKKRVCLCCVIVTIIFSLAASLPFIIQCLASPPSSISRSNFVPLQNVYHQIYDRDDALLDRLEPAVHVSDEDLAFSLPTILQQVYISVKTTQRFHYPRLVILLETWASQVRDHVWFFTDSDSSDLELVARTGEHLVVTNCSSSHHRLSLCCKMEQEFQYFLRSHRQWWCHFDDDNFVNVVALGNMLEKYDSDKSWYLGKTSTASPLKIMTMDRKNSSFWFATGGAGFCVSRTLAMKMAPYAVDGKFVEAGNQFWFPDDVTLGYIIESQLNINLTVVPQFHSHLESMTSLSPEELQNDISFSYSLEKNKTNVVPLSGPFPTSIDPTRFYSLYCSLFQAELCPS